MEQPLSYGRPRQKRINPQQWEEHRQTLISLRVDQENNLLEIKEKMESVYGFHASEKQYKDKFKQWGLAKNISDRDYQKMLQITKRRKLQKDKETSFCIRDKRVPQGKLDRYSKRKGITENDISSPQPDTPAYLRIETPAATPAAEGSSNLEDIEEEHQAMTAAETQGYGFTDSHCNFPRHGKSPGLNEELRPKPSDMRGTQGFPIYLSDTEILVDRNLRPTVPSSDQSSSSSVAESVDEPDVEMTDAGQSETFRNTLSPSASEEDEKVIESATESALSLSTTLLEARIGISRLYLWMLRDRYEDTLESLLGLLRNINSDITGSSGEIACLRLSDILEVVLVLFGELIGAEPCRKCQRDAASKVPERIIKAHPWLGHHRKAIVDAQAEFMVAGRRFFSVSNVENPLTSLAIEYNISLRPYDNPKIDLNDGKCHIRIRPMPSTSSSIPALVRVSFSLPIPAGQAIEPCTDSCIVVNNSCKHINEQTQMEHVSRVPHLSPFPDIAANDGASPTPPPTHTPHVYMRQTFLPSLVEFLVEDPSLRKSYWYLLDYGTLFRLSMPRYPV